MLVLTGPHEARAPATRRTHLLWGLSALCVDR